jgi:hypothetical protein
LHSYSECDSLWNWRVMMSLLKFAPSSITAADREVKSGKEKTAGAKGRKYGG